MRAAIPTAVPVSPKAGGATRKHRGNVTLSQRIKVWLCIALWSAMTWAAFAWAVTSMYRGGAA